MSTDANEQAQLHPLKDGSAAQTQENDASNISPNETEHVENDMPTIVKAETTDTPGDASLHALGGPLVQKDYAAEDDEAHILIPLKEDPKDVQDTMEQTSDDEAPHTHVPMVSSSHLNAPASSDETKADSDEPADKGHIEPPASKPASQEDAHVEAPVSEPAGVAEPPIEEAEQPFTSGEVQSHSSLVRQDEPAIAQPAVHIEPEEATGVDVHDHASDEGVQEPTLPTSDAAANIVPPVQEEIPVPEGEVTRPYSEGTIPASTALVEDATVPVAALDSDTTPAESSAAEVTPAIEEEEPVIGAVAEHAPIIVNEEITADVPEVEDTLTSLTDVEGPTDEHLDEQQVGNLQAPSTGEEPVVEALEPSTSLPPNTDVPESSASPAEQFEALAEIAPMEEPMNPSVASLVDDGPVVEGEELSTTIPEEETIMPPIETSEVTAVEEEPVVESKELSAHLLQTEPETEASVAKDAPEELTLPEEVAPVDTEAEAPVAPVVDEQPTVFPEDLSSDVPQDEAATHSTALIEPVEAPAVHAPLEAEDGSEIQASLVGDEPAVEGGELSAHLSSAPTADAYETVTESDPAAVEAAFEAIDDIPHHITSEAIEIDVQPSTEEPVSHVVAELAAVPTPEVDLAAPTPDAIETDALALGTATVTESGPNEDTHEPRLLVQVLETPMDGSEDVTTDAAPAVVEPLAKEQAETPSIEVSHDAGRIDPTEEEPRTQDIERPRSPWTPSYSVSSQGPGIPAQEKNEEPMADVVPTPLKRSPSSASLATPGEEERPRSPWTPSYSVTNQGPDDDAAELDKLEQLPEPVPTSYPAEATTSEDTAPETAPNASKEAATTEDPIAEQVSPAPEVRIHDEEGSSEITQPAASPAADIDRPKSPWTPSYSVTTMQGSAQEEKEIEQLEQLPEPKVASESAVEAPAAAANPDIHVVDTTEESKPVEEASTAVEPERPKSPWTLSYSVTTLQGTPGEVEGLEQLPPAAEPAQEDVSEDTAPDAHIATEVPQLDESANEVAATAPEIRVDADISAAAAAEAVATEIERPKSPWTPSYSVTTLQGGAQDAKELEQLEQLPASVVSTDAPATKELKVDTTASSADPERPKSPWTPSYSVTTMQGDAEDAKETEQLGQLPAPATQPAVPSQDLKVDTGAAPSEPDRPKSPWTPSYSVTTLEGSAQENKEINELEPLPAPVAVPAAAPQGLQLDIGAPPADVERPKSPWTPSYSVTTLEGQPEQAKEEEQSEPLPAPVPVRATSPQALQIDTGAAPAEPERPKSPWTPSYSVTTLEGQPRQQEEPEPVHAPVPVRAVSPQVLQVDTGAAPAEPERPKSPWTPSYSVTNLQGRPEEQPTTDTAPEDSVPHAKTPEIRVHTGVNDEPQTDTAAVEPERPKSPWTPSYSVTTSGVKPEEAKELGELAQLPPRVAAAAVPAEVIPRSPTPEIRINDKLAQAASGPPPEQQAEPERPKSPWTPSYSVTTLAGAPPDNQDVAAIAPLPAAVTAAAPPAVLQRNASTASLGTAPAEQPERPKSPWTPSYSVTKQGSVEAEAAEAHVQSKLAQLAQERAAGSPKANSDVAFPASPSESLQPPASPKSGERDRFDSVSSSRFFPGGWFSSSPKLGTDGLPDNEEGGFAEPPVSAVELDADERKRWCVVM